MYICITMLLCVVVLVLLICITEKGVLAQGEPLG